MSTSASPTTAPLGEYTANEKRSRTKWRYNERNSFYCTVFPGHRPRYLSAAGLRYTSKLYQRCADLWPEYFGSSAPCAFSWKQNPGGQPLYETKGLVGITFHHRTMHQNMYDLLELEREVRKKAEDHVKEMAKKGIPASGVMALDIILVREGRDEVKLLGNASAARGSFRNDYVPRPEVIGGVECKKCLKRKRNGGDEGKEESSAQRRRV